MTARKASIVQVAKLVTLTLVLVVALNVLLNLTCRAILLHSNFRLAQAARPGIEVQDLVAGNSRGVNLLDASHPDAHAFNLSYNGLQRGAILALVRDFFQAGNHADTVIVEASGLLAPGANCELKSFWRILPNVADVGAACTDDQRDGRWIPLTRYNNEQFLRAAYYWLRGKNDQAWANDYDMTAQACAQPPVDTIRDARFSTADIEAAKAQLATLQAWLAEHKIHTRLAFVLAPYFPAPDARPGIDATRDAVRAVLGDNFLDLSAALPADCRLFSDVLHVNRTGRPLIRDRILAYARKS